MSKFFPALAVTSIALSSAVATTSALASEATRFVDPPGIATRAQVRDELAQSRFDRSVIHYGDATVFVDGPSTASRAQVLAELEIWRRSGLAELDRGESPDVFSDRYRRAAARYAALRSSPQFAGLVQSIADERGEASSSARSYASGR